MRKALLIVYLIVTTYTTAQSQIALDSLLEKQIYESSFIHQPLPLNIENSLEASGWKKEVIKSKPINIDRNLKNWIHSGVGSISYSDHMSNSENGSIRLCLPTLTGKRAVGSPFDPDYATYGNGMASYHMNGANLEEYNRITFSIYPDCDGSRIVNMNISFINSNVPKKKGYNIPTGSHLVNLENKKWNHCYLEIDEYQRNKMIEICFSTTLRGKDRTSGDSLVYYIKNLNLQKIKDPEKVSGWEPQKNKIIYSTTGYVPNHPKTAIIHTSFISSSNNIFELVNVENNMTVYRSLIKKVQTTIGKFGVLDFTDYNQTGRYKLKIGQTYSETFCINDRLWDNSSWRILNFLFCQRCGYPVPSKHATCHTDLYATHKGKRISYAGGWHDAGDLSQQTLQTGDVIYSLLEAYSACKIKKPALAARLREEAEWGLEFILKNRFGDGYRASSMGLLIWQDGIINSFDDISSVRVQNMAFDNFLFAGYEAYASMILDNDPMLQEYLRKVAEEDFKFAMNKFEKDGFDHFIQPYEHSYNTSKSQYMATISWAASQLYKLTKNEYYAKAARENIKYTLECQRTEPLNDNNSTRGFFYRDVKKQSIVHYIHQSREQIYMQAIIALCETQPDHEDYNIWYNSIRLYGNYLKGLMQYVYPYGMIPSGIYHKDEYKDTTNFYALHLFPPTNAEELYKEQINNGIKLDNFHYVKRFPIWFNIFNGNTAVHLACGKSAAICGKFLNDKELINIGLEQLFWTVGKNPFGQSLIYGEGHNYPQLNSFSSGEITGEIPVGIRTLENTDIPYWPQTNNACYKEVWVTSAGKWLSLIAEY